MSTNHRSSANSAPGATLTLLLGVLCVAVLASTPAVAAELPGLTVMGVDAAGNETPVTEYRWLVEEDKTYHVQTDADGAALPTPFDPNWDQLNDGIPGGETLSVGFHRSYMPVVAKGCVGFDDLDPNASTPENEFCNELTAVLDTNKNYYVSVVPRHSGAADPDTGRPVGYSIGGAAYDPDGTTVYVHQNPIPTAQISVLIFHDNNPINNIPDFPVEDPANGGDAAMPGFQIVVEDAGGRYGASAGVQSQDAFGNPLGTTYDAMGNPAGFSPLITGPDGRLTIKNLAPGKYGISAIPPAGGGWQQTSTIEGTKIIDAWVKANEPPFFAEFGPVGYHVFIGFVQEFDCLNTPPAERPAYCPPNLPGGSATLTGTVVNQHLSRPPDYAFYNGACFGHTTPWVGLNYGFGQAVYAAPTDENCYFEIPNVPPGTYQLVVWDNNLDLVFAFKGITVDAGGTCMTPNSSCDLGDVPVFQWFHRQEHFVYDDENGNGIYEDGESPILEQAFNLRWRDGTVYQGNVSDPAGLYAFDQVFPFFSWLVAEVDFVRFQATGLTVVVDNGGPIPLAGVPGPSPEDDLTFGGAIAPQVQEDNPADPECTPYDPMSELCDETDTYRVEHGPVLTQGFQGFLGQTNAFQWGKRHYPDYCEDGMTECTTDADCAGTGVGTETCSIVGNGGLSGIVFYAITRAENDPRYAAAEPWEPGIPGVTVNLYKDANFDRVIDDLDGDGIVTPADVDNYPFGNFPGPEDVDHNDDTIFDYGDTIQITATDSWDDAIPIGCKYGDDGTPFSWSPDGTTMFPTDCYDGLRVFNQARPAVFDGGYAFDAICEAGLNATGGCDAGFASPMPVGDYIVEVIPPPGYEILKPEDKNVDFGDEYQPVPGLLPAECVGDDHLIPAYLTLFPDQGIAAPYAGTSRPLCDRKLVTLSAGANAAADFWLFTEVPVAAHAVGFILDDTQNEFDPNSPNFGEKYAPPFLPVAIRDWTGRIIGRTLSDQYGRYNFLVPSTITTNLPAPSGMSPNMLTACMNDPGDDPNNPDPNWNQLYSTFCYTFQYMPGVTTYLDTPVVPVAAFTGPDQFPLDCEYPDGTPRIYSVDVGTNGVGGGPYIPTTGDTDATRQVSGDQTITITSMGETAVQNPAYCNPAAGADLCPDGADTIHKVITRDHGFGTVPGTVTLGDLGTLQCDSASWGAPDPTDLLGKRTTITCTVPGTTPVGAVTGRQLTVTRDNGESTKAGVTVQVGLRRRGSPGNPNGVASVLEVEPDPTGNPLASPIQDAINVAGVNDLILVKPGTYNEMVVMWKPVQLQGWGEGSTTINAIKAPPDKLEIWRGLVDSLTSQGVVNLLPGQEQAPGAPEPVTLWNEEGAGVLVLGRNSGNQSFGHLVTTGTNRRNNRFARIDGFTIKGADTGGGIIANGYAKYLQISNNRIANNQGSYGGGIRIGHPILTFEQQDGGFAYTDAQNDSVSIHHNQVVFNGGLGGAGGGISMCTGADSYAVTHNWVCGNFSAGHGGGIAHLGFSEGLWSEVGSGNAKHWVPVNVPVIADNTVIFNESFFQAQTVHGGGLFIGSEPVTPNALSPGAGYVRVLRNLIQGNLAGAGDGGGVRLARVNGQDVAANPENTPPKKDPTGNNPDPRSWYTVDLFNNLIVDNVAGLAGGGLSLQDAANVRLIHNTIANNDSLATAGDAFSPGSPNQSNPQPGAGIVSRAHSPELDAAIPGTTNTFSNPTAFADNIVWHNRRFYFAIDTTQDPPVFGLNPDPSTPVYDDLAVVGTPVPETLDPTYSILTDTTGYDPSNSSADPDFISSYFNGDKSSIFQPEITTAIQAPPAFDEGGNFIRPRYGPLSLFNDATWSCTDPTDPATCSSDPSEPDGDPGTLFGDYHIQSGSPAVDAGIALCQGYFDACHDIDYDMRPIDGNGTADADETDIGADEYVPPPEPVAGDAQPQTRSTAKSRAKAGN